MDKPACFSTVRFYENWSVLRDRDKDGTRTSICTDCLPSYQLRMKKAGRCSHPETTFTFDQDGAIVGVMA